MENSACQKFMGKSNLEGFFLTAFAKIPLPTNIDEK